MKEKSSPVNWKNKSTLILPTRHQIDENGNVYDLQNCFSSAASVWQEHTQKGAPTELLHFSSAALPTPYVNDLNFRKLRIFLMKIEFQNFGCIIQYIFKR